MKKDIEAMLQTVALVVAFGEQMLRHVPEPKRDAYAELIDLLKNEADQVQDHVESLPE